MLLVPYIFCKTIFFSSSSLPSSSSSSSPKNVVIVGSGIYGISTAFEIAQLCRDSPATVTILEAASLPKGASLSRTSQRSKLPFMSSSWGNACTLGCGSPVQNLTDFGFWKKIVFSAFSLSSAPPEHLLHLKNKFFRPETLLDPYFYLWGLCWLKVLVFGYKNSSYAPAGSSPLRAPADERACIESHPTISREIYQDGRLIVEIDPSSSPSSAGDLEATAVRTEPSLLSLPYGVSAMTLQEQDAHGSCEAAGTVTIDRLLADEDSNVTVAYESRATRLIVENDKIVGVEINDGESMLKADVVVVCAGASSGFLLASTAGVRSYVPIQPLRGYSLTLPVKGPAEPPRASIVIKPYQLYATRLGPDFVRLTCYGEMTPCWDATSSPSESLRLQLESLVKHVFPNVEDWADWDARVHWMGSRPLTPDGSPVVGRLPPRGLYVNSGGSFNGWRASVLSAKVVAAAYADDYGLPRPKVPPGVSLDRYLRVYSPQRFG